MIGPGTCPFDALSQTIPRWKSSRAWTPERQSREKEVHYKIVDGGRIGYVTQHGYSESERKYQQWDCRHLPEKQMKAKAAFLYKKMRERALTKRARLNPQAA